MKLKMLKGEKNEKLLYTGKVNDCVIRSFGLPRLWTCPRAGTCIAYCYASAGQQASTNVKKHYLSNFHATCLDTFILDMIAEIKYLKRKHKDVAIRLHPCGDFYSRKYVDKWLAIFRMFPEVFFYGYTKSWRILEMRHALRGDNFVFIPSEGGKDDHLLGNRPRAYVFPADGKKRKGTFEGGKDDLENVRQYLKGKSIGLRAHGAKKGNVK